MKNEITLDKTGLTIPGSELAECGMAGVDLSAQMTHSLLLLMPREMTALQTATHWPDCLTRRRSLCLPCWTPVVCPVQELQST